jgi:hypothetical protein
VSMDKTKKLLAFILKLHKNSKKINFELVSFPLSFNLKN